MSLLLSKPSFCVGKPVVVRSSPLVCKSFSTSFQIPHQIVCVDPCRPDLTTVVRTRRDGITVTPWKHGVPMGFIERSGIIGSSNGWRVLSTDSANKILLRDDWIPNEIGLPVLVPLPLCQTRIVTNVAMSSSSPKERDSVVALKFLGPQLSLCMPARVKPKWINVKIENPSFFSSRVMFSRKDKMFHMVGSGGHIIGSWNLDCFERKKYTSKFQKLRFRNLPDISKTKRELLDSCSTSEHLVESLSTDETFMVKWYQITATHGIESMETIALMVFKLDGDGNAVYTQDIGDLIILLTKSECLCAPACSFPKMRPNCVKIWDADETIIVHLPAQDWSYSRVEPWKNHSIL